MAMPLEIPTANLEVAETEVEGLKTLISPNKNTPVIPAKLAIFQITFANKKTPMLAILFPICKDRNK